MQLNYDAFIARVIQNYEGGYGWDKGDPGGPTKYGITCFDLAEHRGQKMTSMAAWAPLVKAMPLAEAEDIYRAKYARALFFDTLRSGPDCCILDYGINSGTGRPLVVARRLLSFTDPDNSNLVRAINAAHSADPKWFVDAMCQERLHFMHQIRGGAAWVEFGKGWGTRVADLDTYCDRIAVAGTPAPIPPPPAPPDVIQPKVIHGSPDVTTQVVTKTVVTGAGAGTAAHVSGAPHWVLPAVIGAVVVAGIAFAIYETHKASVANATVILPPSIPPMPAHVAAAVGASHVGQTA